MSKLLSHTLKLSAGLATAIAMSSAAQANCGNSMYCGQSHAGHGHSGAYSNSSYGGGSYATTGTTTMAPLSSYFDSGASRTSSYTTHSSYESAPSYSSSYSTSYSTGGSLSETEASTRYGSGSISNAYAGSDVEIYGFSGTPDLGAGESLQSTNCPVNVIGAADGSRVLGCYNVVRQAPRPVANTSYYRVVRPVVYVRYPVPVAVPYNVYSPCHSRVNYSRYGGHGAQGGWGGFHRNARGCR